MAILPPQPPKVARTGRDERSLEDMVARIPADLLTAENLQSDCVDELEHEFWTDPCHFLRRACQHVDYGPPGAMPRAAEGPHAPR
jgi:hypothetical protein